MITRTVTLQTPVTCPKHGIIVSEIVLRPLKVRDLVQVNRDGGDEVERSVNLLAAAASLPRETIDEIEMADFSVLSEALGEVMGKLESPAIGKA